MHSVLKSNIAGGIDSTLRACPVLVSFVTMDQFWVLMQILVD